MSINDQPIPIIINIFQYLDYPVHFKLRSVCKTFLNIIDSISGIKPRNWFECVLTDNIYYFKKYVHLLDLPISSIKNIDHSHYTKNFLTWTIGKFILMFYLTFDTYPNYMRRIKICEFLKNKKKSWKLGDNDFGLFEFTVDYNVLSGDLINLQKINNMYCKTFFISYGFLILPEAVKHGRIDILKYMFENYNVEIGNVDLIILMASENDHKHIINYLLEKYSGTANPLLYKGFLNNHLNLLECMKENNLLNNGLFIDQITNINLPLIKFYVDNFDQNLIFMINVKSMLNHKVEHGDYESVDWLLTRLPELVDYVKEISHHIKSYDYNMMNIFLKHRALITDASITCKIIYQILSLFNYN